MSLSQRRSTLRPPVTRHFEFTRLQEQLIALAYQALIPVVSRHPGRPGSRQKDHDPVMTTPQGLRSRSGGA
jgi:hypothetical protein